MSDFWATPPKPELEADLVNRCRETAKAMGVYLMEVGQYNAKRSGTTRGFPDLVLVCAGHVVLIELKRLKVKGVPGGILSLHQEAVITKCADQGVTVHVVDRLEQFVGIVNWCRRT